MASQPIFYTKNRADLEFGNVTVTASEGSDSALFMLNRENQTAWVTVGSSDASGTNFVVDMVDVKEINRLILVKHNWKAFTIQYWDTDLLTYVDFSTPISETTNSDETTLFTFDTVFTDKIKVIITGTQTADDEKILFQFIATKEIGQLSSWFVIKPTVSRSLRTTRMLSGRFNLRQRRGYKAWEMTADSISSDADLTLIESLYNYSEGFLFWPGGGDETQFSSVREGWRKEDIFLTRFVNEYEPAFYKGIYVAGIPLNIQVREVVT